MKLNNIPHSDPQIVTNLGPEFDAEINHPTKFLQSLQSQVISNKRYVVLNVPNVEIRFNFQFISIPGKAEGPLFLYDEISLSNQFKQVILQKHMSSFNNEPRRFQTSIFFDTALQEIENIFKAEAFRALNIKLLVTKEEAHSNQIEPAYISTSLEQLKTGLIIKYTIHTHPHNPEDPLFKYLALILRLRTLRNSLIVHERQNTLQAQLIYIILPLLMFLGLVGVLMIDKEELRGLSFCILVASSAGFCVTLYQNYSQHYLIPNTASHIFKKFYDAIPIRHAPDEQEEPCDTEHRQAVEFTRC